MRHPEAVMFYAVSVLALAATACIWVGWVRRGKQRAAGASGAVFVALIAVSFVCFLVCGVWGDHYPVPFIAAWGGVCALTSVWTVCTYRAPEATYAVDPDGVRRGDPLGVLDVTRFLALGGLFLWWRFSDSTRFRSGPLVLFPLLWVSCLLWASFQAIGCATAGRRLGGLRWLVYAAMFFLFSLVYLFMTIVVSDG